MTTLINELLQPTQNEGKNFQLLYNPSIDNVVNNQNIV